MTEPTITPAPQSIRPTPPSLTRVGALVAGVGLLIASLASVSTGFVDTAVSALPVPPASIEPVAAQAPLPNQQVVCPGPLLSYVGQETTPRGFSAPDVSRLGADITEVTLQSEEFLQEFAGTDGQIAQNPVYFEQPAAAGYLGGVSIARISSVFAWGLAAQTCQTPVSEGWLVAGSTITGRQGVVSLANPGSVPATVDLTVYGESGPIVAPAGRGILLQPGERRAIGLSGLVPTEPSPVIRVQASGTPVSVTLHAGLTRGLDPDGADLVGLQAPPSTTRVLPGLWLESEEALARVSALDGYEDIGPVLRLLAPGADSTVVVRVIRPVLGDLVSEVSLEAGRVFDVALNELGQGHAAVVLESDNPIVSGIRHSSVGNPRTDLAWLPSAPVITELGSVVVPGGVDATLHVVSMSDSAATVQFARVAANGEDVLSGGQIDVPGQGLSPRALGSDGGAYLFETDSPVAIAVVLRAAGELANLVVTPPPAERPAVEVFVR